MNRGSGPTRVVLALMCLGALSSRAQTVTIDTTSTGRRQIIDGFGTCISGSEGLSNWWQNLYFDDLRCSVLRMDLTPPFKAPFTGANGVYNAPTWGNPGPENNYVRSYTNALDYTAPFNGQVAPIAVMGPNINENISNFDYSSAGPKVAGALAKAGVSKSNQLGDFKLIGSLWSPAPWVKLSSGNVCPDYGWYGSPMAGAPWPFIWLGNFAGGKLDTSGALITEFDDSSKGGSGPTSALTQFARCTAAYIRGFQYTNNVRFYAISIQNELNFEEFYNSCTYPLSAGYIAALKAVRSEFDKYEDLATIKIMGPEDLLGGDIWGMWQYGGGSSTIHKNLQYLQFIAADANAAAAEAFFCIHGYASDGVSAANATPTLWDWWANGWNASPFPGAIPANVKGFSEYGKKSWMTETSGEDTSWLSPSTGYPNNGGWSIALRIHQALTTGQQSAWVYWQMTDGSTVAASTLTDANLKQNSPKYVAAKHFFRYIRPDSVRVEATVSGSTNLLASAYLHDTNRTLAIVLLNTSPSSATTIVNVPAQPSPISAFRTFTSSNGSYWQASSAGVTNGQIAVTVPGYGISTLYGVASPTLTAGPAANGQMCLSWGQAGLGFTLQTCTNLVPPLNWVGDTNTVSVSNSIATASVPAGDQARFYWLVLP
jgi:hypothetical protein